eukprot:gene1535-biopygen19834
MERGVGGGSSVSDEVPRRAGDAIAKPFLGSMVRARPVSAGLPGTRFRPEDESSGWNRVPGVQRSRAVLAPLNPKKYTPSTPPPSWPQTQTALDIRGGGRGRGRGRGQSAGNSGSSTGSAAQRRGFQSCQTMRSPGRGMCRWKDRTPSLVKSATESGIVLCNWSRRKSGGRREGEGSIRGAQPPPPCPLDKELSTSPDSDSDGGGGRRPTGLNRMPPAPVVAGARPRLVPAQRRVHGDEGGRAPGCAGRGVGGWGGGGTLSRERVGHGHGRWVPVAIRAPHYGGARAAAGNGGGKVGGGGGGRATPATHQRPRQCPVPLFGKASENVSSCR